jgi:hypothetical protein
LDWNQGWEKRNIGLELKLGKEEYWTGTKVRRRGTLDWN